MVTDRCATLCLIMVLCTFYPEFTLLFQVVVALDISSHWMQMYSSLLHGENSHKVTDLSANPLMRLYYSRPVLFAFCAGNELFFAALYVSHFTPGNKVSLFGYDAGVWPIMAVVTFPISFLKQMVSVLQLVVASQNIGGLDAAARSRQQHS